MAFVTGQRRFSNLLNTEGVNGTRVVDCAAWEEKGRGECTPFENFHVAS